MRNSELPRSRFTDGNSATIEARHGGASVSPAALPGPSQLERPQGQLHQPHQLGTGPSSRRTQQKACSHWRRRSARMMSSTTANRPLTRRNSPPPTAHPVATRRRSSASGSRCPVACWFRSGSTGTCLRSGREPRSCTSISPLATSTRRRSGRSRSAQPCRSSRTRAGGCYSTLLATHFVCHRSRRSRLADREHPHRANVW